MPRKSPKAKTRPAVRTKGPQGQSVAADINARAKALADGAQRLCDALETGRKLSETLAAIDALRGATQPLISLTSELDTLEKSLKDQVDRDFLEMESNIRSECDARGWRLDGQWPKLYVERAIPIVIDEKRRLVSVGETALGPVTTKAIVNHLESAVEDLLPRNFSGPSFLASLVKAYDTLRGQSGHVPILRLYRQLVLDQQKPAFWGNARADGFVGMSIEQFRSRFSRLLEEGVTQTRDRRELRLLPALDPKDAIFLYQPAEARFGFIGRVEFVSASGSSE